MSEKTFTKAQLAEFDGAAGKPAYVAIDGTVYDVSNVKPWAGGKHHGQTAGQDLSDVIIHAPHGKTVLEKLDVVGKYVG
ncbi:cytochrome b5 domain-containing protein [Loigolactobacillus bifermentans]|uniref:Cytochrome b5 heme-binding domain-containing protein n=1 Tax=Loigolactobacillus bifermentans DSM 20003 TaxID=1423726 RepID=A0A0R1H3J8_9LACO|nr:cytochrome b5 domain-containing protein [Loigolactobacillus bifermentans]KRK40776.1 hypothetical protein FC07_GL002525 [Loigolactobacillus bifermentans DSM 20003]QGG59527.1 cytochrome B5 [Loigolactobacillus bifermentans]